MKLVIDEKNLYYGISLENDNTGSVIENKALEEGFRKQDKRHITILSGSTKKLLENILSKLSEKEKKNILGTIKNILESLEWKYKLKEIYRIKKTGYIDNQNILENRESYVNLIDMPDMNTFYQKINLLLKTKLPIQVPHITLFTKGERKNPNWYGIPISSAEEFKNLKPQKIS